MTMILEADKFVIMMDKEDKKPIMILVMIMELETLMHMIGTGHRILHAAKVDQLETMKPIHVAIIYDFYNAKIMRFLLNKG